MDISQSLYTCPIKSTQYWLKKKSLFLEILSSFGLPATLFIKILFFQLLVFLRILCWVVSFPNTFWWDIKMWDILSTPMVSIVTISWRLKNLYLYPSSFSLVSNLYIQHFTRHHYLDIGQASHPPQIQKYMANFYILPKNLITELILLAVYLELPQVRVSNRYLKLNIPQTELLILSPKHDAL